MAIEVKLDKWDEDQSTAQEAAVSTWFKKPGQPVRQGDLLAELIVEKVNLEVDAPVDGVLLEIRAEVGQAVEPGTVLARIGTLEEWTLFQNRTTPAPFEPLAVVSSSGTTVTAVEVVASPAAKRLIRENNLTISEVAAWVGNGVQRLSEEDVKRYLGSRNGQVTTTTMPQTQSAPFTGRRKMIGERMSRSLREMAQLTISSEVDVTELVERRSANPSFSYTAFVARAVALTLPRHPMLNASLNGDQIRLYAELNLGIAVDTTEGLLVPVIKGAEKLSVEQLTAEISRLAELARQNRLSVEDSTGGTFTISNLGAYDVDVFTPIINPPQVAILGVGRIADRAGVVNGQLAPRKLVWLSLSFDHRIIDGGPAAAFLKDLKGLLEQPDELFKV